MFRSLACFFGLLSLASAAIPQKNPVWSLSPGKTSYYINSVAVSGDGSRVVGGTFFHKYGASLAAGQGEVPATSAQAEDPQAGLFGTYVYDASGNLLFKDEFQGWQGVYWVDLSKDGKTAASGGWYSNNPYNGFVSAYDVDTKTTLLAAYKTKKRVNQVVLSSDGTVLLSAAEALVLFRRSATAFTKVLEYPLASSTDYFVSADLSADGTLAVASTYSGSLLVLKAGASGFETVAQWQLPSKAYSHMVRVTPDGQAFVSGGNAGLFYYFDVAYLVKSGTPLASYQIQGGASVYGVAVADDGSAFVGLANKGTGGLVYYVVRQGSQATLKWTFPTDHNPNCVALNLSKDLLAVADGHPDETPGAFYALQASTGQPLWQFNPTPNMSWPIVISADGSAVVAGSDDSQIYYFTP